jgi:LuxR family maltose regulon positive regulatory protein
VEATESLLTTKLYLPPRRQKLVPRPRLLALLSQGLTRPLTLISAPAGFGKTTLFVEWRSFPAGKDFPLAWLSLDHDDNDLSRFLLYLLNALGTLKEGLGETALAALHLQQPLVVTSLLTSLVNDLNTIPDDFALVLDDYHLITAQPVHEALQFLLEALPPQMHLVLLTRADPPLPLARLRARGQLTEIRLPALRFQPDEAAQFLNGIMGLGLSPSDISALESRTEGWIAGLQLAAISLQQLVDKHSFVSAFAGDDRYVMDFLLEEVLQRQPPILQAFLLKTSFLERLNGPLCQIVTGENDSQDILSGLEQANLFVEALDNKRYWYRYHPLFADLLRHRLRQSFSVAAWSELVRQACGWYEREGMIVEAVSQALAVADHELAADLLERHVLTVFYLGETMLVHHWLQSLPEAVLRRSALLCAMYANTVAHQGLFQPQALVLSESWLQAGERLLASPQAASTGEVLPVKAGEDLTRGFMALSRAYLALWKGEMPQKVIDLARKALSGLPPETDDKLDPNFQRLRSGLTNNLAISYMNNGDEDAAIHAYTEAQRIGESCGDLLNMCSAIASQAFLQRRHGRLHAAADLCRKALQSLEANPGGAGKPMPYTGVIYVSLGQILVEWNDLQAAEPVLLQALELSRLMAAADGQLESLIALARLKQARGDFTSALGLLDQGQLDSEKSAVLIPAMRTRLCLAKALEQPEYLEKALHWSEGKTFTMFGPWWVGMGQLTLARVWIARRWNAAQSASDDLPDPGPLMDFLAGQIESAESKDLVERLVELRILQALAWQAQNRPVEALESLRCALELGESGGYTRLFLDEGLPVRKLLVKLKGKHSRMEEYIDKLLDAGGWLDVVTQPGVSRADLVEPLSARELEVLQCLAEGASNADIARRLVITLNTTKKHMAHIFEKLSVTDRVTAVRRARGLGLLGSGRE